MRNIMWPETIFSNEKGNQDPKSCHFAQD